MIDVRGPSPLWEGSPGLSNKWSQGEQGSKYRHLHSLCFSSCLMFLLSVPFVNCKLKDATDSFLPQVVFGHDTHHSIVKQREHGLCKTVSKPPTNPPGDKAHSPVSLKHPARCHGQWHWPHLWWLSARSRVFHSFLPGVRGQFIACLSPH